MRWCAALALVLVALVAVTVKNIRRPERRAAPAAAAARADVEDVTPQPAPPAPPEPPPRRASSGIGHLRGRVLLPAGAGPLSRLTVTADDGRRTFDARITEHAGFALHMPAGRYLLTAWAGDLVGELRDVWIAADTERDVEIPVAVGATIAGRLQRPNGTAVAVVARPMDSDRPDRTGDVNADTFEVTGLIPGRRYDVEFDGEGVRRLKLTGVVAPTAALGVTLEAKPIVRIAVGFPVGGRCPIDSVQLSAGSDQVEEVGSVGNPLDCRFELTSPVDQGPITVVAQGDGWLLQGDVAVPERGDPELLCLNPPCRDDPLKGTARLKLALEGDDEARRITATALPVDAAVLTSHTCGGSHGRCDIEGLRPGETFSVAASGPECRADPVTVTVVAGDNHVRLPCRPERRIEGVVRVSEDRPPDRVVVRCAGGHSQPLRGTRLFQITCGADVSALEYQIGTDSPWRSIPIASLSNPAFVDIGSY